MGKTARCVCGEDLTDGRKLLKHIVKHPIHVWVVEDDGQAFLMAATKIDPKSKEIEVAATELELLPRRR